MKLLIIVPALLLLCQAFCVVVARLLDVTIKEFSFGVLSSRRFIFRGVKCKVGLLPISTSLVFADSRHGHYDEGDSDLAEKSRAVRFAIRFSGSMFLLLVSGAFLGREAIRQTVSGIPEFLLIFPAFSRCSQEVVPNAMEFVSGQPLGIVVAYTCTKLCSLNLLPYPGSPGGQSLLELANVNPASNRYVGASCLLGVAITWVALGMWGCAIVKQLR